jgi:hypothetical protein
MGHEDFRRCVDSDTVSITSEKCVSEAGDDEMVVVEAEGRESRIHIQHKCTPLHYVICAQHFLDAFHH